MRRRQAMKPPAPPAVNPADPLQVGALHMAQADALLAEEEGTEYDYDAGNAVYRDRILAELDAAEAAFRSALDGAAYDTTMGPLVALRRARALIWFGEGAEDLLAGWAGFEALADRRPYLPCDVPRHRLLAEFADVMDFVRTEVDEDEEIATAISAVRPNDAAEWEVVRRCDEAIAHWPEGERGDAGWYMAHASMGQTLESLVPEPEAAVQRRLMRAAHVVALWDSPTVFPRYWAHELLAKAYGRPRAGDPMINYLRALKHARAVWELALDSRYGFPDAAMNLATLLCDHLLATPEGRQEALGVVQKAIAMLTDLSYTVGHLDGEAHGPTFAGLHVRCAELLAAGGDTTAAQVLLADAAERFTAAGNPLGAAACEEALTRLIDV